ncbi:MAG: hypothetical protein Q9221_003940 [Calogaya cf. arnoldii]
MLVPQAARDFLALFMIAVLLRMTHALPTDLSKSGENSELEIRQDLASRGIIIEAGACPGQQLETVRNAVIDASYLAAAGLSAASSFRQLPFTYFFKSNLGTAKEVGAILQRVVDAQKGLGEPIYVTCQDKYKNCDGTNAGYTAQHLKPSGIPAKLVLCPLGLSLRRNPKPCTARPGAITLGWLMLHNLVLVKSIAGPTFPIIDMQGAETASEVRKKLVYNEDTTKLADAYAHLGSWSYDLGFGFEPWHQENTCEDSFWSGQFDVAGLDSVNPNM